MDENCVRCIHKPICRLWYGEVVSRYQRANGGTNLEQLNKINEELAKGCRFWKEEP